MDIWIILSLLAVALFLRASNRSKKKEEERLAEILKYEDKNFLRNLESAKSFLALIDGFNNYITWKERDRILADFSAAGLFFDGKSEYYEDAPTVGRFNDIYQNFHSFIKNFNQNFVKKEKERHREYFNNIEGKSLDDQQRVAVVTDEYSNLIVAGAGSGKTLTILGKVKYLIEKRGVSPERVLLLSFTNKTVDELNERLKGLNLGLRAVTFHKLGFDYVKKYADRAPTVANEGLLGKVVNDFLRRDILSNESALRSFVQFMACYMVIPEEDDRFDSLGEKIDVNKGINFETLKSKYYADDHAKARPSKIEYRTFSGERVKSAEELIIANFLFLNGINYEYERTYPFDVINENGQRISYAPDFYLNDYDIYLEHFGVDKEGRARWNATEFNERWYLHTMKLKRKTHEVNNTKLLETYSWYNKDNILLDELSKMLKNEGVEFKPLSEKEIYEKISKQDTIFGSEVRKLVASFINLSKSRKMTPEKLKSLFGNQVGANAFTRTRQRLFLDFILPIIEKYNETLSEGDEIDFNDMINHAADLIAENGLDQKYDYIIIDEYQDISVARFELIKQIRDLSEAKLVCVGDDWQSIYRFAGSDVSLFSDFENFVGESERLLIERTYRNSQQLIDITAEFIQKNPRQIKKRPKSSKQIERPVEFIKFKPREAFHELLRQIRSIVNEYGADKKILILGRHSFDLDNIIFELDSYGKIIKGNLRHGINGYNETDGSLSIRGLEGVDIKFITVHKSKGLESDNVIILNVKNDLYGFPNKLTDDPMLSLLLSAEEEFRFAEERRLFYVALTRTKNKVYLLVPENESLFVGEILENAGYLIQDHRGERGLVNCLWCKTGKLVVRKNGKTGRDFLGCSHYPHCDETYNDIGILLGSNLICPSCQSGFLIKRQGRYGSFLGCTNFPNCRKTLELGSRELQQY